MSSWAIVADMLVKRYGEVEALRGVSFRVKQGEIYGMLGPNGAGKTTTIHILATLLKPTSGSAYVAGYSVTDSPREVRRAIGIAFQDPSLDGQLTAYENLYVHGRIYGMKGRELEERIEYMLSFVGLERFRDKLVKTFSGGMRRRLEIARALVHKPQVLFLDEPTLGLDPQTRAKIWDHVRQLRKEEGVTVLLTTHYMDEAEELCDRISIIDRGRVVAEGSPEELKELVGDEVVYLRVKDGGDVCGKISSVARNCKSLGEGRVAVRVSRASEALPALLEEASRQGLRVAEVSYRRPTLNDVFLYLTGREIRDSEATLVDHMRLMARRTRG